MQANTKIKPIDYITARPIQDDTKGNDSDTKSTKQDGTKPDDNSQVTIAIVCGVVVGVIVIILLVVLFLRFKAKRRADNTLDNDENPTYGNYSETYAVTEMADHNEDYGGVYEEGVTKTKDNNSQYEFSME